MTVYELGDTVTLTHAGASDDDAQLFVTAPDGTESTPSVTFNAGTGLWSGSVTANQYDQWEFAWRLDGAIVDTGTFTVGGPWYSTLAQLRAELNIPSTNSTHDAGLAARLLAASRAVEEWCDNRPLDGFSLADDASAKLFRFDRWTIYDRDYCVWRVPVREFGSLDDLVVETSTDGTTWTATTDYETWPLNALDESKPITHLVFDAFGARLRVNAKWGWPSTPNQVSEATLRQAARWYRRKDSPDGIAGSSDWGLIRVPNLDPDVRHMLSFLRTEALIA